MPTDLDLLSQTLAVVREGAEVRLGVVTRLGSVESRIEAIEKRLGEIEAVLEPVKTYFEAQNKAAAEATAARVTADARADAARVSAIASAMEWFTVKRLAALAAILVPLCGGGGTVAGALNADRLAAALAVLAGQDAAAAVTAPPESTDAPLDTVVSTPETEPATDGN